MQATNEVLFAAFRIGRTMRVLHIGASSRGLKKTRIIRKAMRDETILLLMVIPFVIFVIVFSIVPLFGWYMAFVDYTPGLKLVDTQFVGLKYFTGLFSASSDFLHVMRNTFITSFLGIASTPIPIVLAVMINEVRSSRYRRIVQTIASLPNFTSWIIIFALVFSFFSYDDGLVNTVLLKLKLINDPTNVLGNADIVWYFQSLLAVWKGLGWNAIIYLGAIAGIDQELYEAAYVDGAGKLRRIWHVTVPGIMPTFVVILFLSSGNLLSGISFDQVYVFHNALVHDKIQTLNYYIYSLGLKNFNFSLSTATGIFNTVVSVVLLTITGFISKKIIGRSLI